MAYSTERKQAVLRKLLPPYNRIVADLAKQEGVSTAAIYQWRKAARAKGQLPPENSAEPDVTVTLYSPQRGCGGDLGLLWR